MKYAPPSHHNAPEGTSSVAAAQIEPKAATLRAKVLEFIAGRGIAGATDEEVQAALQMDANTERPRRYELVGDGLVRDSGMRRKTTSGRPAAVWIIC